MFTCQIMFLERLFLLFLFSFLIHKINCQDDDLNNNSKEDKKKITKLQIGIKKRIENCEKRTSKGDIVHIHYKVCCNLFCFCIYFLLFFHYFFIILGLFI